MARKIVWSDGAKADRKDILLYWINRNKSSIFSRKLNELFKIAIQTIVDYPQIGKPLEYNSVRAKIVRDYLIVYRVYDKYILIITIWDARQDHLKLQKIIE